MSIIVADDDRVTALALAAGRGDRAALEQFIRATERDVWRTVAFLADRGSVDDLAQETYLRALGALPRFAGRSSARTWLLSIARRVVVDQVRRNPGAAEVCGCPLGTIRSRVARARDDLIAAARRDDLTG